MTSILINEGLATKTVNAHLKNFFLLFGRVMLLQPKEDFVLVVHFSAIQTRKLHLWRYTMILWNICIDVEVEHMCGGLESTMIRTLASFPLC